MVCGVPDVWDTGMLLRRGLQFVQKHCTWNLMKKRELLNTSPQAIDLNLICLRQAYSNRPGTSHGYKNTEHGCILAVLLQFYISTYQNYTKSSFKAFL